MEKGKVCLPWGIRSTGSSFQDPVLSQTRQDMAGEKQRWEGSFS